MHVSLDSPTVKNWSAESINVKDEKEGVFKRIYLNGTFGKINNYDGEPPHGLGFEVASNFMISFQASDNIIDYREPNNAMGNRLRNALQGKVAAFAKKISQSAKCKVDE